MAPLLFALDPLSEHLAKSCFPQIPGPRWPILGQVGFCGLKISLPAEAMMPYADGETPVLGDYVKNDLEEPGTVTRLRMASNGDDFVSIRWDDGGVDSPLTPAKEFTLISRQV